MTSRAVGPSWAVHGASITGSSHGRTGLPNQDAIAMRHAPDGGLPVVLCVSDGHGSDKCFRSDRGSKLAVEVATELTWDFIARSCEGGLSEIKRALQSDLPRNIVRLWRHRVVEDIHDNPFVEAELAFLRHRTSPRKLQEFFGHDEFFLAYGATLVLAAVLDRFAFYLQLGDGDVISIDASGTVDPPIAEDPGMMANETTSLCMATAVNQFRSRLQVFHAGPPQLVLVSTDGYANSFASTKGFHQSAPDLLRLLRRDGLAQVQTALPSWLQASSAEGSGDDVTLGFIWQQQPASEPAAAELGAIHE